VATAETEEVKANRKRACYTCGMSIPDHSLSAAPRSGDYTLICFVG